MIIRLVLQWHYNSLLFQGFQSLLRGVNQCFQGDYIPGLEFLSFDNI